MTPNDREGEIERQLAEFKRNNQLAKNSLSNVMEGPKSVTSPKLSTSNDGISGGKLEGTKQTESMQM